MSFQAGRHCFTWLWVKYYISDSLKCIAAAFIGKTNWSSWQIGSFLLSQKKKRREDKLDAGCWMSVTASCFLAASCLFRPGSTGYFNCPIVLYFSSLLHLCQHLSCFCCLCLNYKFNINFLSLSPICSLMSLSLFQIFGMQSRLAEGKWLSFPVADFV